MHFSRLIKPALLTVLAGSMVAAQPLELTLEKARQLALENNPQVKLAEEAVNKAEAQVLAARGGLLPSVSAFSSYQRAWDPQTTVIPNFLKETVLAINPAAVVPDYLEMAFGLENTLAYGLSLSQPLFLGGALRNSYRLAGHGSAISKAQLQSARQSVLLNVTNSYYSVLFARAVVDVTRQGLAASQENLDQVQQFRATGKASDFDVLRAEVQVANYKPQVVSAENNARLAESQLLMVLGLEQQTDLAIQGALIYEPCDLLQVTAAELTAIALRERAEVTMLQQQGQIAQRQLALARAASLPNVMLSTTYQYQIQSDDLDFGGADAYKSFNSSLSLSVPLFTGWTNRAKIQQARVGIDEARYQEKSLLRSIELEVEAAYFSMKEAEENVSTQSKIIASAQEALRLARLRYSEGASTQLEVMNAEVALNQARMNYQRTLFDYNIAWAQLKKALNQL